jgi:hypothetical protein
MPLSSLTSSDLQRLVHLIRAKEKIQGKLDRINAALNSIETPAGVAKVSAPTRKGRKSRRHGGLKDAILKQLHAAGKAGLTVKELATGTGASLGSVRVWVYTEGKKAKGLKKIAPGRFALSS